MIVIRDFDPADIHAALSLERAHQPTPWTEGVFNDELSADNRVYLVAEDSEVVGFGGVMLGGDEAHVTNLLVAPEHRGRGVGRRLAQSLIQAAIEEGAKHLTLEVRSGNVAARALYAGLGLVPVGIRPDYYQDDDALVMWAHDIDSAEYMEALA